MHTYLGKHGKMEDSLKRMSKIAAAAVESEDAVEDEDAEAFVEEPCLEHSHDEIIQFD